MKSGTSLLRVLIGRHPNIFSSYETHWFTPDFRKDWRNSNSKRQVWLRELYQISPEVFETLKREACSGIDFFSRFMEYCTRRAEKCRWAEKTPDNLLYLDVIWEHWPRAPFIHVIREFKDIFASWKKTRKASLTQFIQAVQYRYRKIELLLGERTSRYREVQYERLVRDPRATMRDLVKFLDEPWVEGIEHTDKENQEYERVLEVVGVQSATASSLKKPIFRDSVGQWRSILTESEARQIEESLAPFSNRLGLPRAN